MQAIEHATVRDVVAVNDADLVARLADAYPRSVKEFEGHGSSFWASFAEKHADFKDAFERDDRAQLRQLLQNPGQTELFWGFDDLVGSYVRLRARDMNCEESAQTLNSYLVQIAIGTGALRCPYPDQGQTAPQMATEDVLTALDRRFGFRVDFPNIFNFECGLKTSRGIASYRAVQSLYQAWQTRQLAVHVGGSRILEIGAGLGRNTYYARKFGLEHYTIVDIPTTQLAQGYYLGRVMGADHVSLCGESDRNIRLRSPAWLRQTSDTFDVVVNVDSLTEMDRGQATDYVAFARARSRAMLSINHEFNHFTVAELFEQAGDMAVTRAQYWARPGYVEEVFLTRIHQEAMEAKNALAAMLASTSWRATAPLRRIKSRLWGP